MRLMDRRCMILGAIAAVHVVVGIAFDALLHEDLRAGRSEAVEFVSFSLAVCQGSILAFWAALGGKSSPWRFVLAMVIAGVWFRLAVEWNAYPDMEFLGFVRCVQVFLLGLLLLGIRFNRS